MTTGGKAAARCACAGTELLTACPLAVELAGATTVTLVIFVTLVTLVTLCELLLLTVICIPS